MILNYHFLCSVNFTTTSRCTFYSRAWKGGDWDRSRKAFLWIPVRALVAHWMLFSSNTVKRVKSDLPTPAHELHSKTKNVTVCCVRRAPRKLNVSPVFFTGLGPESEKKIVYLLRVCVTGGHSLWWGRSDSSWTSSDPWSRCRSRRTGWKTWGRCQARSRTPLQPAALHT